MDEMLVALREKQKELDEKAQQECKRLEREKIARQEAIRKLEEESNAAKKFAYTKCNEYVINHFSEHIDADHIFISTAHVPGKAVGFINPCAVISEDCDRHLDFKHIESSLNAKYPKLQFGTGYMEGSEGLGYSSRVSCHFTEKERKGWLW